jgi:hypothetical protein
MFREPFECSLCGQNKTKRTAFPWLVTLVVMLFGQGTIPSGTVCSDCAPRWATVGGKVLYLLIAIGLLTGFYLLIRN